MKYTAFFIMVFAVIFMSCSSGHKNKVDTLADVGGSPDGVTVTDNGNIYITDISSGEIKEVTEDGVVTIITDLGTDSHPDGITSVTDGTTDILYVADTGTGGSLLSTDGSIVKVEVKGDGTVTTTADFVNSDVLDNPTGIAADSSGNLYVADQGTGDIYRIPVSSGSAGTPVSLTDSLPSGVTLDEPHGLTLVTNSDNSITLYTTDQGSGSNNVVQIDIPASGSVSDVQVTELTPDNSGGTDTGTIDEAKFNNPHGISTDKNGAIFVCDENNNRVQIITPSGNVISLAGTGQSGDSDGEADDASFSQPRGLATTKDGSLLVCDYGNGKVKKITR